MRKIKQFITIIITIAVMVFCGENIYNIYIDFWRDINLYGFVKIIIPLIVYVMGFLIALPTFYCTIKNMRKSVKKKNK